VCLLSSEATKKLLKEPALCGALILVSDKALDHNVCTYLHLDVLYFCKDEWTSTQNNKVWAVMPSFDVWQFSFSSMRKEDVLLYTFGLAYLPDMWTSVVK
jgi:hypothetical protein